MSDTVTVSVELEAAGYDVRVGAGALADSARLIAQLNPRGRTVLVTDHNVARLHLDVVITTLSDAGLHCEPLVLDAGEQSKSWDGLETVVSALLDQNIERTGAIIALGGGVIGDLAGFAASITKRGVGVVQIPTTLLSQVDSSVGGKTGINTRHGKNFVGTFHQPRLVVADTHFLETLPMRERRAGYAEIVKAALIGDARRFGALEAKGGGILAGTDLRDAIAEAIAFKARIVAADERESGARALLNLGHTFAHALEAEAPPDTIRHGEAVAAGLGLAFDYSVRRGDCPAGDAARVRRHLRDIGLPDHPCALPHQNWSAAGLVNRMRDDKKNRGGQITLVLAHGIGNAYIAHDTDAEDLFDFLETQLS
ncbi:3-dehydroquinate synthase [Maricaulis sp. CAU 1757]